MKKTTELKLVITAAVLIVGTTGAFAKDEIRTYSVPKGHPAISKPSMAANTDGISVNSAPVQWTTPADWKELPPTGIRLGNLVVPGKDGKKAEVTIMSFPGDVGGEVANVNRWRGELGLAPVKDNEVSSEDVKVGADSAKLYDFSSDQARTIVASLPREGSTWFFKLRGDKEVVTSAADTFREFLKTIRFEGKAALASEASAPVANPHADLGNAAADPHAGIAGAPPLHATEAQENSDEPKWNVPANWKAKQAGMMVLKAFDVAVDGKQASVAISVFPGDVGGTFGNVNRWRGQMSLPPIKEEDLAKSVTTLNLDGGDKGTMVDLNGVDAKTSKAARLIAVAVRHGDNTWFYKLLGDDAVVAHEKEAFLKFVQTVRYP